MSAFGILWRAAVLYLGLAAAWPTSIGSLGPHPKPARDYEAAMQSAQAFQRADTVAATGGESIVLLHGHRTPRAFVLFHGLANSPRQYGALAATLYAGGDNVFAPRLPQHALRGGTATDLRRLKAESLRDVAAQPSISPVDSATPSSYSDSASAETWRRGSRNSARSIV